MELKEEQEAERREQDEALALSPASARIFHIKRAPTEIRVKVSFQRLLPFLFEDVPSISHPAGANLDYQLSLFHTS